jgi:hypothetical protein
VPAWAADQWRALYPDTDLEQEAGS